MAKLIYSAITSLDDYVADEDGDLDWAEPDEEVHAFVNDLERSIGTHLYGRRMYEVMVAWETWDTSGEPPFIQDFARIWRASDKVVYSRTTLEAVSSARTRIEREFDPEAVPSPRTSACSWRCWTNAASATAWFTCDTARRRRATRGSRSPRSGALGRRPQPRSSWGRAPGRRRASPRGSARARAA